MCDSYGQWDNLHETHRNSNFFSIIQIYYYKHFQQLYDKFDILMALANICMPLSTFVWQNRHLYGTILTFVWRWRHLYGADDICMARFFLSINIQLTIRRRVVPHAPYFFFLKTLPYVVGMILIFQNKIKTIQMSKKRTL